MYMKKDNIIYRVGVIDILDNRVTFLHTYFYETDAINKARSIMFFYRFHDIHHVYSIIFKTCIKCY